MQGEANFLTETGVTQPGVRQTTSVLHRPLIRVAAVGVILFLAFFNLTNYPVSWFDEGSHLHVPKTFVKYGVYADYSSEGFRYYGPTIGVGPTVMLPIAAAFKLFGIGLFQARLVMALYMLAAIYAFYLLARHLGGEQLAWAATALLLTSQSLAFVEYGREVLGEVPGLFFALAGLVLWFATWERPTWGRLCLAGLLFGLSMVTKNQYLLVLAPTLGLAWLANLVYYRQLPQRIFLVPGIIAAACFAAWQVYTVLYLGPATASENLAMLREFTSGAALVFRTELMKRGVKELLSPNVYLGLLAPVLIYGLILALPRRKESQQWGVLLGLIMVNLVWYVVASISWLRYAFPGLAITALFVARFFYDLTEGFRFDGAAIWSGLRQGQPLLRSQALRLVMMAWFAVLILLPLAQTVAPLIRPGFNAPAAMAAYMDANIPTEALVETWEPEMGFLTDHNYHFPPPLLLNNAVGYIWLGGPPPADDYDFVEAENPAYILVGGFSRWVNLYEQALATDQYEIVTTIGGYELYQLK